MFAHAEHHSEATLFFSSNYYQKFYLYDFGMPEWGCSVNAVSLFFRRRHPLSLYAN